MTPIEIIEGRYGYQILTGAVETDLTGLNIVAIVIRSPGATLAKLAVGAVNIITSRAGLDGLLDVTDPPILAGFNDGAGTTKLFTNIQLTAATDSVCLYYAKSNE